MDLIRIISEKAELHVLLPIFLVSQIFLGFFSPKSIFDLSLYQRQGISETFYKAPDNSSRKTKQQKMLN